MLSGVLGRGRLWWDDWEVVRDDWELEPSQESGDVKPGEIRDRGCRGTAPATDPCADMKECCEESRR